MAALAVFGGVAVVIEKLLLERREPTHGIERERASARRDVARGGCWAAKAASERRRKVKGGAGF
jgi:hypothetical protein